MSELTTWHLNKSQAHFQIHLSDPFQCFLGTGTSRRPRHLLTASRTPMGDKDRGPKATGSRARTAVRGVTATASEGLMAAKDKAERATASRAPTAVRGKAETRMGSRVLTAAREEEAEEAAVATADGATVLRVMLSFVLCVHCCHKGGKGGLVSLLVLFCQL